MVRGEVVVKDKLGLHARPAGLFSKSASNFKSSVYISKNDKKCNAKSILGVLSLCVKCGDQITIECDGDDESAALESLVNLLEKWLNIKISSYKKILSSVVGKISVVRL